MSEKCDQKSADQVDESRDNGTVDHVGEKATHDRNDHEGVETMEELRCVIILGVDLIQGYYTGYPAPLPLQEIDEQVGTQIRRFRYNMDHFASVIPT